MLITYLLVGDIVDVGINASIFIKTEIVKIDNLDIPPNTPPFPRVVNP